MYIDAHNKMENIDNNNILNRDDACSNGDHQKKIEIFM